MSNALIDRHNRTIDYLRISVTDRCNLRCHYCVPPTPFTHMKHNDILSYEELLRVVRVGVSMGIKKVRLTGGEPFVRKGLSDFIGCLGKIPGIEDISVTTNGTLIADKIETLKKAGLTRINISLDSLKPKRFKEITQRDEFHRVDATIKTALAAGLAPVKLNTVLLDGVNGDELEDFARLTLEHPIHVRFIEYMPIGEGRKASKGELLAPAIIKRLEALGPLTALARHNHDGPARRFKLEGAKGEIGLINPMSNHFCATCNRLRLSADGNLRPCLLSDTKVSLKEALRNKKGDDVIAALFQEAVSIKGERHNLSDHHVHDMMYAIGG